MKSMIADVQKMFQPMIKSAPTICSQTCFAVALNGTPGELMANAAQPSAVANQTD